MTPGKRLRGALNCQLSIHVNTFHPTYSSTSSKIKRLTYGQLGEVCIGFSLVNTFSPEVLVHCLLSDTLVIQVRVLSDMETIKLSGDGL